MAPCTWMLLLRRECRGLAWRQAWRARPTHRHARCRVRHRRRRGAPAPSRTRASRPRWPSGAAPPGRCRSACRTAGDRACRPRKSRSCAASGRGLERRSRARARFSRPAISARPAVPAATRVAAPGVQSTRNSRREGSRHSLARQRHVRARHRVQFVAVLQEQQVGDVRVGHQRVAVETDRDLRFAGGDLRQPLGGKRGIAAVAQAGRAAPARCLPAARAAPRSRSPRRAARSRARSCRDRRVARAP